MHANPLEPARPTDVAAGLGAVTRKRVEARTREIALSAGRVPPHVVQADYEQAKRELTGASDPERQAAILDGNPETKPPAPAPRMGG